MDKSKYLIVHVDVLPEVFPKVLEAKRLIKDGQVTGITEAVKEVGISRSTYYKYSDFVFPLNESNVGRQVTMSLLLYHESGVLSNMLEHIAKRSGNVLTISQNSPIDNIANVSISIDISSLSTSFSELLSELRNLEGVNKLTLVAME